MTILWNLQNLAGKNLLRSKDKSFVSNICTASLSLQDDQIQSYCWHTLRHLTDTISEEDIKLVAKEKLIELICSSLTKSIGTDPYKTRFLVRIVCNILCSTDQKIIQKFLDLQILDTFNGLLNSTVNEVKFEILWGLSNLAAQSNEVINILVEHEIYEMIK